MNKFKRVERIIEGKIIEIEIGHNTLQYVLTKRLTGMRFLGTKKHKLKIKNSIRRANTKNLKHKGFSDEEIEKFLDEIGKSAKNPIEKMLFKQEFTDLYKKSGKHSQEIYKDAVSGATIPQELADKLWISRTCTNTGSMQEISIKNMIKAYNYIESVKNRKPEVADLVKLHKIVLADTPEQELIGGRLRLSIPLP